MIVADTNVLSEPLRQRPARRVVRWLKDNQEDLAITAVTVAELRYGARRLPRGRRRTGLLEATDQLVADAGTRLLPFGAEAADAYGALRAAREQAGHPMSVEGLMIAATCLVHGAALATRNVRSFDGCGLTLIDPWADETGQDQRSSGR